MYVLSSDRRPHGGEPPDSGALERLHEGRPVEKGRRVTKICTSVLVTPGATGAMGKPGSYGHPIMLFFGAHLNLVRVVSSHRQHGDRVHVERARMRPDLVFGRLRRLGQARP